MSFMMPNVLTEQKLKHYMYMYLAKPVQSSVIETNTVLCLAMILR